MMNVPIVESTISRDGRGFIYVEGVKLGRVTAVGLEIQGQDRRIRNAPIKRVVVPIDELICFLGQVVQE